MGMVQSKLEKHSVKGVLEVTKAADSSTCTRILCFNPLETPIVVERFRRRVVARGCTELVRD